MSEFATVCPTDEIPNGEGRSFEIENRSIAIFNNDGNFSAIDDMCPHMGASLSEGYFDPATCNVACPWHGWRFNVNNGAWADNPRVKTDVFEVRVVSGEIQIKISPAGTANRDGTPTTESESES